MRGLYAIVDTTLLAGRRIDPILFAGAILQVRPAALQLRAKDLPSRETLGMMRALGPMCRRAGVPLVANDRPDLAVLAGCDWVHVGQTDMPIGSVRRIAPSLGVGVSTHNLAELAEALAARPAYVAYGPVFETSTKKNPEPVVGMSGLRAARALAAAAGVPLVAIGGITSARAVEMVGLVDSIAVIADLLPPLPPGDTAPASLAEALREVTARARALHELFVPPASVASWPPAAKKAR
jgi:thiamine-phosphate pyrophosphorylase